MTEEVKSKGNKKKPKDKVFIDGSELITLGELEQTRKSLIETNADLVVQGMLNRDVRAKLRRVVERDFNHVTKGNTEVIDYIIRETIGTGVIEDILKDDNITDVGYNGTELVIEGNDSKINFDTKSPITDDYIVRLVNKFANTNNKEFTSKNPIFDGRFENVRINAVHTQNTAPESGTTMALRVVRPRLILTDKNFEGFAPMFMYDFFKTAALVKYNMVISGTTGTGKTELHKLIASFIPFDDRILLIEDTPETFLKSMFPDKDIYSWVTSEDVGVTELIKAGLRNNPDWIMVTETRGQEAYEMIQAVLSGHSIITSLHAVDARAIPSRFVNMAKMGYELSEEALIDDIRRYFNFGIHIKKVKYKGHVVRYLQEVLEFHPDGDRTIFKQRFIDGVFTFETFELSEEFINDLEESHLEIDFPENFKSNRPLDYTMTTFESIIPIDPSGRPDYEKIRAMGTTLEALLGHETVGKSVVSDTTPRDELDMDKIIENVLTKIEDSEKGEKDIILEDIQESTSEIIKRLKDKTVIVTDEEKVEEEKEEIVVEPVVVNRVKPKAPPVRRRVKPKKRELTLDEILEKKRQQLKKEDL